MGAQTVVSTQRILPVDDSCTEQSTDDSTEKATPQEHERAATLRDYLVGNDDSCGFYMASYLTFAACIYVREPMGHVGYWHWNRGCNWLRGYATFDVYSIW